MSNLVVELNEELFNKISVEVGFGNRDLFIEELFTKHHAEERLVIAKQLELIVQTEKPDYEKSNGLACAALIYWSLGDNSKAKKLVDRSIAIVKPEDKKGGLPELIKFAIEIEMPSSEFSSMFKK